MSTETHAFYTDIQATINAGGFILYRGQTIRLVEDLPSETNLIAYVFGKAAPQLGDTASKNVGTAAGTVAAGDDTRITGSLQKASNLADVANTSSARTALGLGSSAVRNIGTVAGTVAAGDDSRL